MSLWSSIGGLVTINHSRQGKRRPSLGFPCPIMRHASWSEHPSTLYGKVQLRAKGAGSAGSKVDFGILNPLSRLPEIDALDHAIPDLTGCMGVVALARLGRSNWLESAR